MEIVNYEQARAMYFVSACNRSGHRPKVADVDKWLESPQPRDAVYRSVPVNRSGTSGMDSIIAGTSGKLLFSWELENSRLTQELFAGVRESALFTANFGPFTRPKTRRERVREEETLLAHLTRLGWLALEDDKLTITLLGKALLKNATREADDDGALLLNAEDSLAYPMLIGKISDLGYALVIDGYLELEGLQHLLTHTSVDRVLVSSNVRHAAKVVSIVTYLTQNPPGRTFEVRSSNDFHDRYVIPREGDLWQVGLSLNGVGKKKNSYMAPVPSSVTDEVRTANEAVWQEAEVQWSNVDSGLEAPDDAG